MKKTRKLGKRLEEIGEMVAADREKMKHLKKGARLVTEGKWEAAEKEFELALGSLESEEKDWFLSFFFTIEISILTKTAQPKKIVNTVEYAMKIHERVGNEHLIALGHFEVGIYYVKLRKYDKALKHLTKAAEIFVAEGDRRGEAEVREELGNAYMAKKQFGKAIEEFQKTLELRKEFPNVESEIVCYGNLGIVYVMQKKYGQALECWNKVLELQGRIGQIAGTMDTHINIANAYAEMGKHQMAAEHYMKALKIAERLGDDKAARWCRTWLAEEYRKMGMENGKGRKKG
ncbi:MAG: tetratricopeptide repeat protein [Thermoplasmata archaeon]|nr:tetratricopeptide repeat protein [Thermoplasmata archaeon]